MKTSDFTFYLPQELIAQSPLKERGQSRLMTLNRVTGERSHRNIPDLKEIILSRSFSGPNGEKPLLVLNNTKVRKARVIGISQSGKQTEFLLLEKTNRNKWKTLVQRVKRKKPGQSYLFYDKDGNKIAKAVISENGIKEEFCCLEFENEIDDDWLEKYGHIPLPPYIKRKDTEDDAERYQTVYASLTGSAAAPTAGLHFTEGLLNTLYLCGIESVFLTLHVGLGTFQPVRSENITDHIMHEEQFFIKENTAQKIEQAKEERRKIIAVGTTSLRALESAYSGGIIKRGEQKTSIFIYPGYNFKITDALFTNFHTPLSSLLILVCAFAGKELILESYAEAVKEGYRFFSYGDAMLIY